MTNRELLELAALAAGIELDWDVPPKSPPWRMTGEGEDRGPASQWTPLTDDGDALRLAVKLRLELEFWKTGISVNRDDIPPGSIYHFENDPCAATRRAIVRAAAEIGQSMKASPTTDQAT